MARDFTFDAGNLALDLVNTDGRYGGSHEDGLQSPAALLAWLAGAGVLPEGARRRLAASPPESRVLLAEAHRLRHEVRAAVDAMAEGCRAPESARMTVNRLLRHRPTTLTLTEGEGGLSLEASTDSGSPLAALGAVAEAAAHLMVGGDPSRLRQCHADDCRCWFVDTSKNGRRKWCSMARCGNRAKVAAHYRRHRAP